jgi:hypothetical protein
MNILAPFLWSDDNKCFTLVKISSFLAIRQYEHFVYLTNFGSSLVIKLNIIRVHWVMVWHMFVFQPLGGRSAIYCITFGYYF